MHDGYSTEFLQEYSTVDRMQTTKYYLLLAMTSHLHSLQSNASADPVAFRLV